MLGADGVIVPRILSLSVRLPAASLKVLQSPFLKENQRI